MSTEQVETIISNIIYTSSTQYNSASLVCCKLFKKELIIQSGIRYPEALTLSEDRIFNILAYRNAIDDYLNNPKEAGTLKILNEVISKKRYI